jgi:hypothetical protein
VLVNILMFIADGDIIPSIMFICNGTHLIIKLIIFLPKTEEHIRFAALRQKYEGTAKSIYNVGDIN